MEKVRDAVDRAGRKGIRNTLVLTDGAALIVNTGSGIVLTAMNQREMRENIITNIDGTVII
jgi:flagellar operon protein